jgi:hypothetical protein
VRPNNVLRRFSSALSKATIVGAEPQLLVTDIQRSCEFFRDKLGFSPVFSYGKPPYYVQVSRDAAHLNLGCVERPIIEPAVRDREELLSLSMTVATAEEIKLLFLEFQSAGVAFHQTLMKQPWALRISSSRTRTGICSCLLDPQTNGYKAEACLSNVYSRLPEIAARKSPGRTNFSSPA